MKKILLEQFPIKGYFHLDYPLHISKVKSYVQNREAISRHSFFPLISYTQESREFTQDLEKFTNGRPFRKKDRPIKYAGHLDGYIYKHYANQLNSAYNTYAVNNNIDDCSIAYRNNKKGKSNIDFAAEVISLLHKEENAYVLVGDFKNYFETLNHHYLKKRVGKILKCDRLEKDWYNIFQSVTKYGYVEKKSVESFFGEESELRQKGYKKFPSKDKTVSEFRKNHKIKSNDTSGVPQGVPISAVLANIYAIDFDESVNKLIRNLGGIYRRYSDDFIIVIPEYHNQDPYTNNNFQELTKKVYQISEDNQLKIATEKTHMFKKRNEKIFKLQHGYLDKESYIDYLGFVYDGQNVSIRQKSIERFYRKMKRFVRTMESKRKRIESKRKKIESKNRKIKLKNSAGEFKKIPRRNHMYNMYTDRGVKKGKGRKSTNFIEYAKQSQRKFDVLSPDTNNMMMDQIKNRKKKLEKLLGMKIYVRMTKD